MAEFVRGLEGLTLRAKRLAEWVAFTNEAGMLFRIKKLVKADIATIPDWHVGMEGAKAQEELEM
ncbi:MAG: hypothetical protein ABSB82_10580 [Terriglobia bacterium]|jgi:hypothetical protein